MVAIVTGAGLGTERSSANVLGGRGQLGSAGLGQGDDLVTINAANGNLVISHQDEILIGRGPDGIVSRTYNSQGLFTDDNGDNWRLGIQRRLTNWSATPNVAGATVTRTGADGTDVIYTYDTARGAYVTTDGNGAHDTIRNIGHWVWTDGDTQVAEVYDIDGNLINQTDTDGNGVSFQYTWHNASWRLSRVQTTGGDYTDLGWTGSNLTSLTTSYTDTQTGTVKTLTRTRYDYDGSNRLIKVTVDLSPEDGSVADGQVYETTYGYDTANRVNAIAQSDGTQVAFAYDGSGRVTAFTRTVDTGITRTTTLTYGAGYTSITDPQGQVTTQYYDGAGQLTRVDGPPPVTGGNPIITRFTYDANRNVTLVTKYDGYTNLANDSSSDRVYYRYDGNGNLFDIYKMTVDQNFEVTRYYYGNANELLTETRYTGLDADGWIGTDPMGGMTTRYVYDAKNRLRFAIGAEGEVVEYVYSTVAGSTWKLTSTIRYTAQAYDVSGLSESQSPSEATMAAWVGTLADRSTVERTDLTYDFRGNVSTTTSFTAADTAGVGLTSSPFTVTTFVYDQFGLLLSKQVSGRTGSEVYTYDGLGRMLTSTDFAGNVTTVAFDSGNRRTTVTLANGSTVTTNLNRLGQALDQTTAGAGATSQVESYKYDALARLKATVDALATKDYTFYDAAGRKTGYMDRLGNLTEYRYDAGDRLIATIEYATAISPANLSSLFDGAGNPLDVAFAGVRPASAAGDLWTWNTYDDADRLTGTIAADGAVVQYVYDGAGRLVKTTSFANRLAAGTIAGYKSALPTSLATPTTSLSDRTTRYFYDKTGRRIGTLDADGALTRSVYDAAGRVVESVQYASLTTQGLRAAGTWAQLLSSVTGSANPADRHQYFAYDDQGNLRFTLDGKRNVSEIVYDNAGRAIRTLAYGAPIGATAGSYGLAYIQGQIASLNLGGGAAVRTSRTTYDGAGRKAFDIDSEGYVTAFAYGALDQVVKVTRFATALTAAGDQTLSAMQGWASGNANASDRVTRQVYDGLGRLVYEVDAEGYVTEHQYDQKNRLLKDIRYPAAYAVADGVTLASLVAQIGAVPAAAITTLFEYDASGNRTKVTDGEGFATQFTYDTLGRNTQVTNLTTGVATQMVYDALDRVIQTTSAYGTAEALTTSFAYDGAGNLVTTTDARGSTTSFTYDAQGNRLTEVAPLSSGVTATTTHQYDAFGNITATTDPLGRTTVFTYDALDHLVGRTVPLHWDGATASTVTATTTFQYDAFGNVVAETDPRGVVTWYYYDRLDRLVYTVDGEGYATQNSYSIGGAITSVRRMATRPTGTGSVTTRPSFIANNAVDGLTTFTRDKLDRVTTSTDAEGYHEDYALDAFGNRISVTNRLGNTTTNLFDKRGLLKQEVLPAASIRSDGSYQSFSITNTFSYDSNGNRTQMVEAAGLSEQRTTTYVYDKHDRLIQKSIGSLSVLDPTTMALSSAPSTEYYSYDGNGNVIEAKDANGSRTLSYYDLANRKIAELSPVGTLSTWTYDANGNVQTARVYGDAVGLPGLPGGIPPSPQVAGNYRETTFTYDFANRQVGTVVAGLTIGSYNGSSYTTSTAAVSTATQYDKAGNVIVQTDGNGGRIYSFYDQLNRRIGQIDQAGYVTRWTLDHEGNVTQEKRFASKYTGAITAGGTLPLPTADAVDDRTTDFTYDRNGRRKTETRQNVKIATVSGGSIAESTAAATITYTYNGLGLVTSKQEATGDTTTYGYDEIGRQNSISGQSYTDYTGATVSNQQAINYDGLNNVTRTVENSARVTAYAYGAGGRLSATTDAAGNTTRYFYDAAGHVTATTYRLVRADGSAQYVGQSLQYDAAGRQLAQKTFTSANETNWAQSGDTTDYFYDAYGQVIARGTSSGGVLENAQEFNHYDKAGRVWRTNFGDGVTKAYIHDANRNATLLLQSIGAANLKTGYADVNGMLADTGVSKTISVFDARNQLIDTIQSASNNAGASPVQATQVNAHGGAGTVYFNSNVSITANRIATGASAAPVSGVNTISATMAGSTTVLATRANDLVHTIGVDRFNLPRNGGGNIHVVIENDALYSDGYVTSVVQNSVELGSWPPDQSTIYIDNVESLAGAAASRGFSYHRIVVYQDAPGGGRIILSQTQDNYTAGTYVSGSLNGTTYSPPQIQIQNANPNIAVIRAFARPQGSSGPYSWVGTASQVNRADGSPISGFYAIDASGLQGQNWDIRYYAFDSAGNVLDAKSAVYQPNAFVLIDMTSTYLTSANMSESVGLFNSYNLLLLSWTTTLQVGSVELLARPSGSGQGFLSIATAGVLHSDQGYGVTNDLAGFEMQGWNFWANNGTTAMDYQLVYRDFSGNYITTSSGVLTGNIYGQAAYSETPLAVNGPGQVMATWDGSYYTMLFTGLPTSAQNLRVFYRLAGTNNAFAQLEVTPTTRGGAYGQAGWWSGRPPADGQNYEFWVEPLDGNGGIIGGRSYGTFVGGNGNPPANLTQYGALTPTINFQPPPGHPVTNQRMRYSSNGGASWSSWIDYGAGGVWTFNASALAPDFYTTYGYAVEYETYNSGTMVSRATGGVTLGYASQAPTMTNAQSIPAKVQFNPKQTGGAYIKLFYRTAGSTGAYSAATIARTGGIYAWDVDAAGVRPPSGSLQLEYYYDVYDANNNRMANLVGSDHVQGTLTISSDHYANTTGNEIRWDLDTASASPYLIHRRQTHNAFGEIASETDGRNYTTSLYYNTEGRLIQKVAPQVTVTSEAGADSLANPTDYYYYDKSGRQVAQRDANGNLTTQTLLAGSGYGGSQALVTAEYRPGSVTTRGYDNWGDERTVTDGLGAVTTKLYDANHNLVEVDHPVRTAGNSIGTQLKDYYAYDALGQRIKHWNSQLGAGVVETTDYDAMGRVTRTVSMGGQWTNYIHTYYSVESGLIATPGLGNFGGWQKITSTSAGGTHYENKDLFGRTTAIYDFGAHHSLYNYDNAGHLVQQTNNAGQNVAFTYYENGYVKSITDNALQMQSTFEYDNNGNRTRETYNGIGGNPVYYQNAAITYDAMNRMTRFLDPKADIQYKYDAVGNRRNIRSLYQDGVGGGLQEQNYWYKYDGQNRFVTTMGTLSGGVILRGSQGVDITYDAAGNRATATYGHDNHTESYSYTADGYLENASTNGVILSRRTNDALGRVIQYTEYAANGVTAVLSRWSSFDNDNRATADTTDTVAGSVTTTVAQTYDYRAWNGAAYAGADQGVVTHTYAHQTQSGTSAQLNTHTNYYYVWWDEAKQSSIIENASNPANPNSGQWAPGIASLSYDVNGHVVQVVDQNAPGGARITNYRNDAYGQVMVREQQQNGVLGARQLYYYFNGMRIGDVGNNGPSPNLVDYAQQLAARGQARDTGLFRYGRPVASADFDQNYQPINAGYPGTAASSYTVRTGDTLATIAQALWGDSAMWYLIAEANGLASSSQLIAGQRLIIPNKVTNVHNNTGTFRVYNPGEAIGDTLPTLPNEPAPPPARKKGGCGGIGAILLAVVAIAVTAWVAPHLIPAITNTIAGPTAVTAAAASGTAIGGTAAFAGGVVGGAIAGAAGSIVSQGLGLATGLQDRFNWGAVGLAAIGAGVSGGLAGTGAFGGVGSKIVGSALRGAAGNAVSQGLGIATGLQDRFDWGGVAAAGVGAGISSRITLPGTGGRIVSGMAGGLAASAAESLVTGRDFGDTIAANLPGIIGNTVGGIVAEGIAGNGKPGAGGSTTGAGDGTSARPTPGAGGGQVGGSGSGDDAQPGDIVVTARRGGGYNAAAAAMAQLITQTNAGAKGGGDAGGVAAVAAIDRGNHPYPVDPEDMSGNTAWQLRAKKAAYLDTVANSGQTFTDNELNVKAFDDLIARADAREAPGVAAADAEVNEILRAGLAPIDIGVGGYNIAVGSGGLRDYLAVASLVPVGKVLGAVGAAARSEIKGFASYSALKRYLGSPGAGNQWHHIVEKTPGNIKAFGAEVIHSTENVVAIPASTHIGKGSISAYYSGKDFFTNGQTVRQWLATQSLQAQRQFGLDTLKRFGQ